MPHFGSRPESGRDDELQEAFEVPKLNDQNEDPYAHYAELRDAVAGNVNSYTKLIALHNPIWSDEVNHFLHDCTRVAEPAQLCQIVSKDGKIFPSTIENGASGYYLYHTYDNLLLAPVDRVECRFFQGNDHIATPYLTVVVEFHFNNYKGQDTGITNYKWSECADGNKMLTFSAGAATTKQFTLVEKFQEALGEEEREVLTLLESFSKPSGRQDIEVLLHDTLLTSEEQSRLFRLRDHLPGGLGKPLPSFGRREYEPFRHDSKTFITNIGWMLGGEFKHPLTPLVCHDAIATVQEWLVSTAQAVLIQHAEAEEPLKLLAKEEHCSRLYAANDRAILAVNFKPHGTLAGSKDRIKLPSQLSVSFKVTFRKKQVTRKFDGFSVSNSFGLPPHDAFFLITSGRLKYFTKQGVVFNRKTRPTDDNGDVVKMTPHYPSFFMSSQIATVKAMERAERWHRLLLNQVHKTLEKVNLVEGIDKDLLDEAYSWLRGWVNWNAEQLDAINGLESVLGGMMLITGPAGTGKTLLLRGLTQFFHMLGLHVAYFAPANKNVNQFAQQIGDDMAKDPTLNVLRVHSPSRDIGLENLSQSQAANKTVGHDNREVCKFEELLIAMEQQTLDGGAPAVPRLEDSVLEAARDGKEKFVGHLNARDQHGREYRITEEPVDAWEEFRKYLQQKDLLVYKYDSSGSANEEHNDWVEEQEMRGMAAYRVCKSHILGKCRFIIATLGNTRCAELIKDWFTDAGWGAPRKGVVVFIDESTKAVEVDAWAPVVCERWAGWLRGIIMAGDEKQLPPVNTCSQGRVQFNPFNGRLNTSLPTRLINMGFPCYRLQEQYRMHPAIWRFPNKHFYGGTLRDGPGTDHPLEQILPGLADTLIGILTSPIQDHGVKANYVAKSALTDEQLRLQWLQVTGTRKNGKFSKSKSVPEHVDIFFGKVLPELQAYFEKRELNMAEHLMIICAYGEAISDYSRRFKTMVFQKQIKRDHVPRVLTVDSAQGQEADMVIFDGSCQKNDAIGFMNDSRRCNVAVTRAKHVFWMIGGAMDMGKKEKHHLTQYKEDCDADGRTVNMN